ncbi:MAG: stage III sporulation protein AB [Clostridia bacterium]|nr:stage III sporulation protein AB [Clostridia bacterium]
MRTVFALMAGLLCAAAGVRHASALKADAARLSRWYKVLQHVSILLKEGTLSIPDALCTAADSPFPPDKLLRAMAAHLSETPIATLAEAFRSCCCIDYAENEPLQRLFTRLGQGSRDVRVLAVEQAAEEIRLLAAAAAEKSEKDAKLWQTLGLTGGICLTILLL